MSRDKKITEDYMVLEWLKGELSSKRFAQKLDERLKALKAGRNLIYDANLTCGEENILRRNLLEFRGFKTKTEMFEGFPQKICWYIKTFSRDYLLRKVHYINYSYWNEISKGTRLPAHAAESIRSSVEIYGQPNTNFLEIAGLVKRGKNFPRLILVGDDQKTIVLEGHARLTGFALSEEHLPDRLSAIYGYSENLYDWTCY